MSAINKELIKRINKALSNGDNEFVLTHLTDDIRWNIVGMPAINGKNDFIKVIEILELENFPAINIKNIIAEGDYVVVESTGKAVGKFCSPSYCDVYHLMNGKIHELTTYVVDTTLNE